MTIDTVKNEFIPYINEVIADQDNYLTIKYLEALRDWAKQAAGLSSFGETHYKYITNKNDQLIIRHLILPSIRGCINRSRDSRVATLLSLFGSFVNDSISTS